MLQAILIHHFSMFWDCLGSVFRLNYQIMLALYTCGSMHWTSFEFRGLFHVSGAIFPCFGTIKRYVSVLKITCLNAMLHTCHALVEWHVMPLDRSLAFVRVCMHFGCFNSYRMATDVSVA